jgi:hypothetical protein
MCPGIQKSHLKEIYHDFLQQSALTPALTVALWKNCEFSAERMAKILMALVYLQREGIDEKPEQIFLCVYKGIQRNLICDNTPQPGFINMIEDQLPSLPLLLAEIASAHIQYLSASTNTPVTDDSVPEKYKN